MRREKELPGGPEEHVVVAVVIPVVVDVHATLVDVEFGVVAIRERSIAHSRPRAPEVEGYCLAAYILFFLYFIREHPVVAKRLYGNLR